MPSNVKLTTAEYRAWRVNKAQWVSPEGYVLRAVTPEEEHSLFPAVERTKQMGKTQSYELTVVYKHEDPESGREAEQKAKMEATVRITQTGRERHNYIADVFVNGCRYVKGREIIEKRMLATHGECNLYGPNGKRLRVIRNPGIRRPSYSESQRSAPHPDNCHCKGWKDKSDPGRHHAACNWNDKAPPNERALPFQAVVMPTLVESPEPIESLAFDPQSVRARPAPLDRPRPHSVVPPPPGAPRRPQATQGPNFVEPMYVAVPPSLPPEQPVIRTKVPPVLAPRIYTPSECPEDCRGVKNATKAWRWPAGRKAEKGQHHPLCQYDGPYRNKLRGDKRWVLYDIERKVEVRDATSDEVTKSELELARSGTRSLTISGRIYAIVQSGQTTLPRPRRPIAGASQRRLATTTEQQHEAGRQRAREASHLPEVFSQPEPVEETELQMLRRRIAELEDRTVGQARVGVVPLAPEQFLNPQLAPRPLAPAAEHLRNELGLVGNQQATDDIPLGPVELADPEPFIDPLRAPAQRRAADYHPGVVRPRGFVPPALPGTQGGLQPIATLPAAVEEAAEDEPLEAEAEVEEPTAADMGDQDIGLADQDGAEDDGIDQSLAYEDAVDEPAPDSTDDPDLEGEEEDEPLAARGEAFEQPAAG